jgi:hypothetical protein
MGNDEKIGIFEEQALYDPGKILEVVCHCIVQKCLRRKDNKNFIVNMVKI